MVGWCSGVFFFKQKTEYEMRISDWSSDVCSSDLQNIEALRNTGLKSIVTLDDRFIDLGTTDNVVRLHRQHFLQGVGSAISLQCPDLHLTEALAAELHLTAQRLLGDEAVGTDRTRMDLVINTVVELQHINIAQDRKSVGRARVCQNV